MLNIFAETFRIATRTQRGWERDAHLPRHRYPRTEEDEEFLRRWANRAPTLR